jgi:hypothetical protein
MLRSSEASRALLVLSIALAGCASDPPVPSPAASAVTAAPAAVVSAAPSESAAPAASVPVREIAGAAHILVAYKGAVGAAKEITRTKEAAKKRAEEALQKLKDKKTPFEEVAKTYNDDPMSKPTGGAIGNFERNAMPAAFSKAVFDMKVDDISGVVETERGFHVIKRTR